jgi:hypothetical protein
MHFSEFWHNKISTGHKHGKSYTPHPITIPHITGKYKIQTLKKEILFNFKKNFMDKIVKITAYNIPCNNIPVIIKLVKLLTI